MKRLTGLVAVATLAGWVNTASALHYQDTGSPLVQNVDDFFGLNFDVRVEDETDTNSSTLIPHVEIFGSGNDQSDFYAFNVPTDNARVFLDIDCAFHSVGESDPDCPAPSVHNFDSRISLYLASDLGSPLATNDDNGLDTGSSTSNFDSFIFITLLAGDYVVEVDAFSGDPQPTNNFILNISVENHPIAEMVFKDSFETLD